MASSETTENTRSEKDANYSVGSENYYPDDSNFLSIIESENPDALLKNNSDFVYSMGCDKVGRCVIFNHTEFSPNLELDRRPGSDRDAQALEILFRKLRFNVDDPVKNPTYSEIKKKLHEVTQDGFDNYSCFVCCIMTHGNKNRKLYAYDTKFYIDDVWSFFSSDKCSTLKGKPKIFIIQACGGDNPNFGQKVSFHKKANSEDREETDSVETDKTDLGNFDDAFNLIPMTPSYSDFLTAYATYDGFYAFKNKKGSHFIMTFCNEVENHYKTLDLVSILTKVNHKLAYDFLSKSKTSREDKLKQMPCFDSSLTKLIKFS